MSTTRFLVLAFLLLTINAQAQIQIGTIKGVVTDPAGAVVADAKVLLTSPLTGERVEAVTDSAGSFVFNNLPFNRYALSVEARGFASQSRPVTVNSNLPLELAIGMSVPGTSEEINITSRENLVDPASASSTTTLTANFIQRAPRLNRGRQLQELIATAP